MPGSCVLKFTDIRKVLDSVCRVQRIVLCEFKYPSTINNTGCVLLAIALPCDDDGYVETLPLIFSVIGKTNFLSLQ